MADHLTERSGRRPELGRSGKIARTAEVFVVVVGFALLFAYAGDWLTPRTLTRAKVIDTFEQVNGPQPGFRRNHAKGVGISGYFESNGQGVTISKASVFAPGRVPVIGRFALAGGQPYQADAPHTVRSMALLFDLPDGQQWRTGMNNIPVFPVATPQGFYELLQVSKPDPGTGKPDPAKMKDFLARHSESAKAMQLIHDAPVSSGFADSTFNSLNAFRFINADGEAVPVRWSMVPLQPVESVSTTQPAQSDPNYLFDALIAGVREHPLQWRLVVTVGHADDSTVDATSPWPSDRQRIDVGTLTIDRVESEETSRARDINFDPLVLPDGIAASDDPLLSARSATYAESFTRREGERKEASAVTAAEVQK
jgi:catalase